MSLNSLLGDVASSQGRRVAQRGTRALRGVQGVGALFGYLGGGGGWDVARGCPTTTTGRQNCWVLQTRPDLTPFIQVRTDL